MGMSKKRPGAARATRFSIQKALRLSMQQAPLPFAITRGAEHTLVYANSALRRLVGAGNADALGAPIATVFTASDGSALNAILDRAFLDGVEQLDERIRIERERAAGNSPCGP